MTQGWVSIRDVVPDFGKLDIGKEAVQAERARQERLDEERQEIAYLADMRNRDLAAYRAIREKRGKRHDKLFPDCEGGFDRY